MTKALGGRLKIKCLKVGLIVPVFNGQCLLPATCQSIADQRLDERCELTVIFVDDGSTDGSLSWLKALSFESDQINIQLVDSAKNRGRAAARNQGLELALASDCDVVTFLDQDDLLPSNSIQLRLDQMQTQNLAMTQGRQVFELMAGCERPHWCRPQWLEEPQAGNVLGATLFDPSVFASIGPFDESLRLGGDDADWFMRARRAGLEISKIEEVVLRRRIHASNGSAERGSSQELLSIVRTHIKATGAWRSKPE